MRLLILLSEPPYNGRDVAWNALRLADAALAAGSVVHLFLINDGVDVARQRARVEEDSVDLARMLQEAIQKGAQVKLCQTCLDRCGIGKGELVAGTEVADMAALHRWLEDADKVVSF